MINELKKSMKKVLSLIILLSIISTPISAKANEIIYGPNLDVERQIREIEGIDMIVYQYSAEHAFNILKCIAKLHIGHITESYDVDADGSITVDDALLALKSAAKLVIIQYPLDMDRPE